MKVLKNSLAILFSLGMLSFTILVSVQTYYKDETGIIPQLRQLLKTSSLGDFLGLRNCNFPLSYRIGEIDPRFNVSKAQLQKAVATASGLWEKVVNKKLFIESPDGKIEIALMYDVRQEETQMLGKLGLTIEQTRASFDKLEISYKNLIAEYKLQSAIYNTDVKNFEIEQKELTTSVTYWNNRGGAPEREYEALQKKQTALEIKFQELEAWRQELNTDTKNLNSMAAILNQMAKEMNIKVEEYNSGGTVIRDVFNAGVYESDHNGKRIYVYQFEDKEKLMSILEHELGHALSLEHNDDKKSIMYRLNQGQIQNITSADVLALQKECPNLK